MCQIVTWRTYNVSDFDRKWAFKKTTFWIFLLRKNNMFCTFVLSKRPDFLKKLFRTCHVSNWKNCRVWNSDVGCLHSVRFCLWILSLFNCLHQSLYRQSYFEVMMSVIVFRQHEQEVFLVQETGFKFEFRNVKLKFCVQETELKFGFKVLNLKV